MACIAQLRAEPSPFMTNTTIDLSECTNGLKRKHHRPGVFKNNLLEEKMALLRRGFHCFPKLIHADEWQKESNTLLDD